MNYVQGTGKSLTIGSALVLAMMALAVAGTAIPAQAQDVYTPDSLTGGPNEPSEPAGLVAQGQDGNLYGYSYAGGNSTACKEKGCGTIYQMSTALGTPTVLYNFPTDDQCGLGLTLGTDGNFYGACTKGNGSGGKGHGYVFQFVPGTRKFNNLGSPEGTPSSRPIEATPGLFYGTTITGGNGYGTVYQITPPGPPTTIYTFTDNNPNYTYPNGPLLLGLDGNLYGTTQGSVKESRDCPPNCGAIYNISPTGGAPNFLYTFTGAPSDGATPTRGVIQGADGNFYGTTIFGGTDNLGTIFQWTPGSPPVILNNFTTTAYGIPRGLELGSDGNLYGDANDCSGCQDFGSLFEFEISNMQFNWIVMFSGKRGEYLGASPDSTLSHTLGTLYGVTENGGTDKDGVFYSLNINAPPFCRPQLTLGQVGSKIGILGQGFSSASQVYFGNDPNPVTPSTETGTFITVTIPAGAQTGLVTVITGSTTLQSLLPFHVQQ